MGPSIHPIGAHLEADRAWGARSNRRAVASKARPALQVGKVPRAYWDEYSEPLGGQGHATTLGPEAQEEAIRLLHEAVFEVTGKRVEPVKRRIGFA